MVFFNYFVKLLKLPEDICSHRYDLNKQWGGEKTESWLDVERFNFIWYT